MNDITIAVVSLIIGSAISLVVTRIYYRRGGFSWYIKDFELFDFKAFNVGNRLSLTADGQQVAELRWAIIAFWNSGSVAHAASAIAPADNLRILITKPGFRQVLKTEQSRRAVNCSLTEHVEGFEVNFDILDENDWVVVYILYENCAGSDFQRPELKGSLLNLPDGFKFLDLEDHFTEKMWHRRLAAFFMALLPIGAGYISLEMISLLEDMQKAVKQPVPELSWMPWTLAVTVGFLGIGALAYLSARWMVTLTRVPKSLLKALPIQKTSRFKR